MGIMELNETNLRSPIFPTWCPGCGDYGIWAAIKKALMESGLSAEELVVCFDIGCSGNMADFLKVYGFHTLHGRALPIAEGIKMANHGLKVLVIGGDGGMYGEGMGHFIAACRGNHDITLLVHDNQTYGLTTGQSSPTTTQGVETKSTPQGVIEVPANPMALALTAGAGWVGRSYSGDIPFTTDLLKQALRYKGFSLLDVFQPCVTFNKRNTHQWFQQKTVKLETMEGYSKEDLSIAWKMAQMSEQLPIGVLYEKPGIPYHEHVPTLKNTPLFHQFPTAVDLDPALVEFA